MVYFFVLATDDREVIEIDDFNMDFRVTPLSVVHLVSHYINKFQILVVVITYTFRIIRLGSLLFGSPHCFVEITMHNIWVRLNAVIFFSLTVLLVLATFCAFRLAIYQQISNL